VLIVSFTATDLKWFALCINGGPELHSIVAQTPLFSLLQHLPHGLKESILIILLESQVLRDVSEASIWKACITECLDVRARSRERGLLFLLVVYHDVTTLKE